MGEMIDTAPIIPNNRFKQQIATTNNSNNIHWLSKQYFEQYIVHLEDETNTIQSRMKIFSGN